MNFTITMGITLLVVLVLAGIVAVCMSESTISPTEKYVFSTEKTIRYQFPTHINDLVIDRSEAHTSEVFIVVLKPGGAPPLHKHDDTEQIFYILEGAGNLVIGKNNQTFRVMPGNVVRIPPSEWHQIVADDLMRYLSIDCFVGGRPKAEPTWDSHVKAMCREQGWDFSKVKQQ